MAQLQVFRECDNNAAKGNNRPAQSEFGIMEFITDITLIIKEADYQDPGGLMKLLQEYRPEKTGSCYKVRGTYEELKNLSEILTAVRRSTIPDSHGRTHQQDEHAVTHSKSVDVSGMVMAYIVQKRPKELDRIQGMSFVIETQPDFRTVHNFHMSTLRVTVRQHSSLIYHIPADFVMQRFITFYQRIASDLQVTSVSVSSHEPEDLQRRFPHVIFKPSHNKSEITAVGPFLHIAKLKEFLLQNLPHSSQSQVHQAPAVTTNSRSSDPVPTHSQDPKDEWCLICMEPMASTERKTLRCKHSFCRDCLKKAFDYKPVCPTCGEVYGILRGTQPDGGKMDVTKDSSSLPGYETYGTIIVHYYIPGGIQKEVHPNPGQPYEGVSRTAYLPDSSEGKRVLRLLRRAFDQRLIFTVGQSTTTGRNNIVTWNDIHHKTSNHGGPTHYGYPDPDYLRRVRDELKAKGVE